MIWAVTSPQCVNEEARHLNRLLAAADVLLLRKPGWTADEYAALIEQIAPAYRHRVMIAGQPELLQEYGLMGLHVSERVRLESARGLLEAYAALGVPLSTSIHQPHCPGTMWQHLLLGPVFNSISKPGYMGNAATMTHIPVNAIAIGGVDAANVGAVRGVGFAGAAVLGALWQRGGDPLEVYNEVKAAWRSS